MRHPWLLAAVVALAGCGGGDSAAKDSSGRVDPDGDPPYIGSLSADPGDGTLYLATNRGLFAIPEGAREARRVTGTLRTEQGSGRVSAALVVRPTGPGRATSPILPQAADFHEVALAGARRVPVDSALSK